MTNLSDRDTAQQAVLAHEAHEAAPRIPPVPAMRAPPPECKTPEQRLLWVRAAQQAWESEHLEHGFRR